MIQTELMRLSTISNWNYPNHTFWKPRDISSWNVYCLVSNIEFSCHLTLIAALVQCQKALLPKNWSLNQFLLTNPLKVLSQSVFYQCFRTAIKLYLLAITNSWAQLYFPIKPNRISPYHCFTGLSHSVYKLTNSWFNTACIQTLSKFPIICFMTGGL